MELTASEIHDMVSQWPEGARAEGLRYADNLVDDEGGLGYWYMVGKHPIPLPGYGSNLRTNREAADLHALAGLEWLMFNIGMTVVVLDAGNGLVHLADHERESDDDFWWGPTLLHAVHAAVLAVKG